MLRKAICVQTETGNGILSMKQVEYIDRKTGARVVESVMGDKALRFAYETLLGRTLWPVLFGSKAVSAWLGRRYDAPRSKKDIAALAAIPGCRVEEAEKPLADYASFNDFFTRSIKPGARPVSFDPDVLISPCDGYMSAYRISSDSVFSIKDSYYNVEDLVGGSEIAQEYLSGTCLVLRLGVENYHRYCYIDDGFKSRNYHIPGRYHPVQPIVVRKHPVFIQNTREYTVLYTKNFGIVTQIEVGACLVGRICNHHEAGVIRRGEEKGYFCFGGSTIVLLFKEGAVNIPQEVFDATSEGKEAIVKYGEAIGRKAGV